MRVVLVDHRSLGWSSWRRERAVLLDPLSLCGFSAVVVLLDHHSPGHLVVSWEWLAKAGEI